MHIYIYIYYTVYVCVYIYMYILYSIYIYKNALGVEKEREIKQRYSICLFSLIKFFSHYS